MKGELNGRQYIQGLLSDMHGLHGMLISSRFALDYSTTRQALECKIKFYEHISKNTSCINCMNFNANKGMPCGASCSVYGIFPEDIKPEKYSCDKWLFDDVPF